MNRTREKNAPKHSFQFISTQPSELTNSNYFAEYGNFAAQFVCHTTPHHKYDERQNRCDEREGRVFSVVCASTYSLFC